MHTCIQFVGISFRCRFIFIHSLILLSWASTSFAFQSSDEVPDEPSSPASWYGEGVRPTEPRSPEDELAGFHLPKGFIVELVAAEPTIAKPLNLAFDARGRLWVTQTVEYPYPAKEGQGRDAIQVLEDRDHDGTFETVITFAEGLNIPIGILPYRDGVIAYSIPDLIWFRDSNGDGVCDTRQKILGPFDTTRDTHGMINSLRRGLDGWIYACHGFNNQSRVAGTDGHTVFMPSGNTFRFRADGSRIEIFTHGQVNPYGMVEDDYGDFFTADCHSKPITQLLRGGCYESFGRPHDGLGFVPPVMDHLHGSTAIAGIAISQFAGAPSAFANNSLSGNVMTSRINRNFIRRVGASVRAEEQPDFLTSDDPWFRPVDLIFGPDGALYVADFYNKIIGHYEVRLDHPERDRFRGRIWRIRYVGEGTADPAYQAPDWSSLSDCIKHLMDDRPGVSRFALDAIENRFGIQSLPILEQLISNSNESPKRRVMAMWAWVRIHGELPRAWSELAANSNPWVSHHAILASSKVQRCPDVQVIRGVLDRSEGRPDFAHAARAACEALAIHGGVHDLPRLLATLARSENSDWILAQAAKIAIRDLLRNEEVRSEVFASWTSADAPSYIPIRSPEAVKLIPIMTALDKAMPSKAIVSFVQQSDELDRLSSDVFERIAAAVPLDRSRELLEVFRKRFAHDPIQLSTLLEKVATQQKLRFGRISESTNQAIAEFLMETFENASHNPALSSVWPLRTWNQVSGNRNSAEPWPISHRLASGREGGIPMLDSIQLGERYTGKLSFVTDCPNELRFLLAGHDGHPDHPGRQKNYVQLVDFMTGQILVRTPVPRNDVASVVFWDLRPWEGNPVRFEAIDGDDGDAFAWIAVGEFSLVGLNPHPIHELVRTMLRLVPFLDSSTVKQVVRSLQTDKLFDVGWRWNWEAALIASTQPLLSDLLKTGSDQGWCQEIENAPEVRERLNESKRISDPPNAAALILKQLAQRATSMQQSALAALVAKRVDQLPLLTQSIRQGWLGTDVLLKLDDAWWAALPSSAIAEELKQLREKAALQGNQAKDVDLRIGRVEMLTGDPARGLEHFKTRCALCHQLDGQGTVLGPQLEGVGGRGTQRLLEDILLPSRNVDEAFRMSSLLLESGTVMVGLIRQRDDQVVTLTDQLGKNEALPIGEIAEEKKSELSLMPSNFGELLSDQELADLLAYIRSTQVKGIR